MPRPVAQTRASAPGVAAQMLDPRSRRRTPDEHLVAGLQGRTDLQGAHLHIVVGNAEGVGDTAVVASFEVEQCATVSAQLAKNGLLLAGSTQHHARSTDAQGLRKREDALAQQHSTAQARLLVGLQRGHIVDSLLYALAIVAILPLDIDHALDRRNGHFRLAIATVAVI